MTRDAPGQAAEELEWTEASGAAPEARRWLFTGRQRRLSLAQMSTYDAHVLAANETDEDFFDNFS